MRKYAVAATFSGAMFAMAVGSPNLARAMSVDARFGVLSATAVTQVEQAGWCGRRGCLGRSYYKVRLLTHITLIGRGPITITFWDRVGPPTGCIADGCTIEIPLQTKQLVPSAPASVVGIVRRAIYPGLCYPRGLE